jgi:2-polyprenyl-3-methyl-5-hydroxy-6-metoxy-1,4-benzoquinol methylase
MPLPAFLNAFDNQIYHVPVNTGSYWDNIYKTKAPNQVSWYRPHLERSLSYIETAAPDRTAAIIDVGGGESTLVDDLIAHGYRNLTVLDISHTALALTKKRLGESGHNVDWVCADITRAPLAPNVFDVWHDRAVFHFLTSPEQRVSYVRAVDNAVRPGGHVIVSTFGPEGPDRCSGLHVIRYDTDALHGEFGTRFRLVESIKELHETPFGTVQQFLYCYCRRD